MKDEICRFAKVCRGYRTDAYSCAHEDEAKEFCGYYRRHKAAILKIQMRAMLKGSELGSGTFAE